MAVLGIWMPKEVLQSREMNMNEKFIYCEILQLSTTKDGCYAGNNHFAELLGVTKNAVSKSISKLVKNGYLKIELKDRNHTRLLSPQENLLSPHRRHPSPHRLETKDIKQVKNNIKGYYI